MKSIKAAVVAGSLALGAVSVGGPAPASAQPAGDSAREAATTRCPGPRWVNVSSGSGHGTKRSGTPIRTGPYESCSVVRLVQHSSLLYYHCWRFNRYNNVWTHVRVAGTNITGWVYNQNLDDGGAHADSSSCALPGPHG